MAMIYCRECGARHSDKAKACPKCGYITPDSDKSLAVYLVLLWLFGMFGAHRFYAGKSGTGLTILMLAIFGMLSFLFMPLGVQVMPENAVMLFLFLGMLAFFAACIWVFVDFIVALCNIKHPEKIFADKK